MGLQLNLPTPQGGTASYHHIGEIDVLTGRVLVASYLTHDARLAGSVAAMGKAYFFPTDFTPAALAVEGVTPWSLAYGLLKKQADFTGAVDVM